MAIRIVKKSGKTEAAPAPQQEHAGADLPWHLRYRPHTLDDVVGQESVVASLRNMLTKPRAPHAFLFTGPSGCGKTTLARIVATALGVEGNAILEVDAASSSGIDNMRQLMDMARYRSLSSGGDAGVKFLLIDECHALSKAAWQSMLKMLEEPPAHVYWALCTTEPDKVPETIRTRCAAYHLRSIDPELIANSLAWVLKQERLPANGELVGLVSRQCGGSMRRALVGLQQVIGVTDKKEALRLLETGVGEEEEAINLARMVCTGKGFNWAGARDLVAKLEGESPEGVRLIVVNYAAAILKTTTHPEPLLAVLDAFRGPFNPSEKWAPVYLAIGALLFN